MKKSFTAILWFTSLFTISIAGYGQDGSKLQSTISLGTNVPSGRELNHTYGMGLNSQLGLTVRVFNLIHIGPSIDYTYHLKHLASNINEQYNSIGYGITSHYTLLLPSDLLVEPGLKVHRIKYSDEASPRGAGRSIDILRGNGFAFDMGTAVFRKRWGLELTYRLFISTPTFNPDLDTEFTKHNNLYTVFSIENNHPMNFSSFILSGKFKFIR